MSQKLTRRGFVMGMGSLLAVQTIGIRVRTHKDWLADFDSHFVGFEELNEHQYLGLSSRLGQVPVLIERSTGSLVCHFNLAEESVVYLSASAILPVLAFIYPLRIDLANQQLLLPILCTNAQRIPNRITLGRFEAGEHQVTLLRDSSVNLDIPESLEIQLSVPDTVSLAAKFIERSPVIRLKNPNNTLDDVPMMSFAVAKRHPDGRFIVTTWVVFSSENGGLSPSRRMQIYGRTYDIEWVTQQIFDADGQAIGSLQRFQSPNHGTTRFAGSRWGDSPILVVATANNNFADNRRSFWQRWQSTKPASELLYAPQPQFFRSYDDAAVALLKRTELQQYSQVELAMEGCVDLTSSAGVNLPTFNTDLEWVKQHLNVVYLQGRCGNKLQLP